MRVPILAQGCIMENSVSQRSGEKDGDQSFDVKLDRGHKGRLQNTATKSPERVADHQAIGAGKEAPKN